MTAAAGIAAVVVGLPALAVGALLAGQAVSTRSLPADYWSGRLAFTLRPAVIDDAGLLLGFLPPRDATNLDAAHAADAGSIPEHCIDLVLAREDAHAGKWWRHVRGVDLGSIPRAAFGQGGASTLGMQLARQLAPQWMALQSRWMRKVREAAAAGALLDLHRGDHRALARTYLSVAPFGVAFGDVRGIAAAADAMWGISPTELSPAQCALLVVLLPRRVSFVDTTSPQALALWSGRTEQARRLLLSFDRLDYTRQVETLTLWPELPRRNLLPGLPLAVTLNLGARTRALVLPHASRIAADDPGPPPPESIAATPAPLPTKKEAS